MIDLNSEELVTSIEVPSEFIRTYLPAAPGEYIKVYLYLLLLSRERTEGVSPETVAKALSCSEEAVMESLRFWKKQNVLELGFANEKLCGIRFKKIASEAPVPMRSEESIRTLKKENKDAAQLIFVAEQYLKRPLSRNDMNVLLFFLEDLKLPLDVCEFVVEYCVLKGHPNIRYIEKVGMEWHKNGISSVKEAKEQSGIWNKYHYEVLKAFGIKNRDPGTKEVAFIEKWRREYGFSMPIISEACGRALTKTGKPSFEYADGILKSWHTNNVTGLKDIEKLDEDYKARHARNGGYYDKGTAGSSGTGTAAAEKEYDFKKIAEDQKRMEDAYDAYPRLSEIDREVSELSMAKARIRLGMSDADDFDLAQKIASLTEERKVLLIKAGYTPEEISDDT